MAAHGASLGHCGPGADIDEASVAVLRLAGGAVATLTASCLGPDKQAAGLDVVAPGLGLELSECELVVHVDGGVRRVAASVDPRLAVDAGFVSLVRGEPFPEAVGYGEALCTHRVGCALTTRRPTKGGRCAWGRGPEGDAGCPAVRRRRSPAPRAGCEHRAAALPPPTAQGEGDRRPARRWLSRAAGPRGSARPRPPSGTSGPTVDCGTSTGPGSASRLWSRASASGTSGSSVGDVLTRTAPGCGPPSPRPWRSWSAPRRSGPGR